MKDLLLIGYEFLSVILPYLITFVVLNLIYKHKGIIRPRGHFLITCIFAIYIFAVFFFTGVGTIFNLQRYGIRFEQVNLLPFSKDIDIVSYLLNILLFIPFGFLFPYIWPRAGKLKNTALSGFSFSLLIEISQLFNNRHPDIDDLLLNTLGTLIGFLLFKMVARITKKEGRYKNYFKFEPAIYILAIFLVHFLIFDEFGMAKILYGF